MTRTTIAIALALFGLASVPAVAQPAYPACLSPGLDDQASLDCATAEAEARDQALIDLYYEVDTRQDDGSKVFMRYAQPAFLSYRDANCAYYGFRDDLAGQVAKQICIIKMTNARISELEAGYSWATPGKGK